MNRTILKYDDIISYNFNISIQIDKKRIERIIEDVEYKYVESNINIYDKLVLNNDNVYDSQLVRLKRGIANLTYGFLLLDNIYATRFGSKKKQSDYSIMVQVNELEQAASEYFTNGVSMIRDSFELLNELSGVKIYKRPYYNWFRGFYSK